jgi:hypothetical protein
MKASAHVITVEKYEQLRDRPKIPDNSSIADPTQKPHHNLHRFILQIIQLSHTSNGIDQRARIPEKNIAILNNSMIRSH